MHKNKNKENMHIHFNPYPTKTTRKIHVDAM